MRDYGNANCINKDTSWYPRSQDPLDTLNRQDEPAVAGGRLLSHKSPIGYYPTAPLRYNSDNELTIEKFHTENAKIRFIVIFSGLTPSSGMLSTWLSTIELDAQYIIQWYIFILLHVAWPRYRSSRRVAIPFEHRVPTRKTCFSHPGDHPTPSRCPRNVSRAILKKWFFMMILIFGGRFLDFHLWRILNKWAKSLEID